MLGTQWIAKKLAGMVLAAVPMALEILVKHASRYVLSKAFTWRERIRCEIWWPRKLRSILTADRVDDDDRADAIGSLMKFETPPAASRWELREGVYWPLAGSGYIRTGKGEYISVTAG